MCDKRCYCSFTQSKHFVLFQYAEQLDEHVSSEGRVDRFPRYEGQWNLDN